MLKMAVLLSGSGRTLDNFHERTQARTRAGGIQGVISNVGSALGLEKARKDQYPAFYAKDNDEINRILDDYEVDIVCLAGYLKLYSPPPRLARAVINIHPALIPSFCGQDMYGHHVHEAVLARGCTVSGCTVHFANENYDEGPIILQKCVPLAFDENADTIASKVFAVECEAFPEAINLVAEKGVEFFWERVNS